MEKVTRRDPRWWGEDRPGKGDGVISGGRVVRGLTDSGWDGVG